ncbi:hypothetical protein COM52_18165 [Bacillus wiedmannii]|nr:hypothetical protein COM52_18165 [Bacillus wiedmannii]
MVLKVICMLIYLIVVLYIKKQRGAILISVIVVYLYTKVTGELSDRKFILLHRIVLAVSLTMYFMTDQIDNLKIQVVKTVLGLSFMLMIQLILKKVIPDMYYVRYALTGITITFLCPFMFHMLRLKSE